METSSLLTPASEGHVAVGNTNFRTTTNRLGKRSTGRPPAFQRPSDFFQTLEGAMDKVQEMQSGADQQVASVLQGNGQDLHSAMVAVEKADLTFQMMMQVRNKIVQAYQTISQMQF